MRQLAAKQIYEAPAATFGEPSITQQGWIPVGAGAAKKAKGTAHGVTSAQLREAERGLPLILARKFSAAWIAKNAKELLAQVNIEYAEWLKDNPPAKNPVGWLLNGAYWRALNLLDAERRKPRESPLEAVFHLADESTPDPEQQVLEADRQRRLREAMGHLPEKERKLLALVYFEDMSIREAGRKVGWQKSAADRHHDQAMRKMLALVGDRSLLGRAPLGPIAWVTLRAQILTHRLGERARRLSPFADAGNAAAAGGGGRALGYCGAAAGAIVCGLLGSGAVGPGMGALTPVPSKAPKSRAVEYRPTASPTPVATPRLSTPKLRLPKRTARTEAPATESTSPTRRPARNPLYRSPVASGQQSASEFGDNNFEPSSSPESPPPSEAPGKSSPAPSSGPSSGSRSSGSSASSEFGL